MRRARRKYYIWKDLPDQTDKCKHKDNINERFYED